MPLQILLRQQSHWRGAPVAVVDDEGPNGRITNLNRIALRQRLAIGMRQATALGLVPNLHTAVVSQEHIDETREDIVQSLQTFSPRVEIEPHFSGAFMVDPEGLRQLYGGYRNWSTSIFRYLKARGWHASVVVGFHRYRSVAVASANHQVRVLKNASEEKSTSDGIALEHFDLPGRICTQLRALGIVTLGSLLEIPGGELRSRFGEEASNLHDLFNDNFQLPIQPSVFAEAPRVSFQVDPPDDDQHRLLFAIKGALHTLMSQIEAQGDALSALQVDFHLEQAPLHSEQIVPAKQTLDLMQVLELIRLRLSPVKLAAKVEEVELVASTERAVLEQGVLAGHGPKRNLRSASEALAKVRAAYGAHSVSKATLRDAHLPEAAFGWEPVKSLKLPQNPTNKESTTQATPGFDIPPPFLAGSPALRATPGFDIPPPFLAGSPALRATPLVRRIFSRPRPLPPRTTRHPESGPRLKHDRDIEHLYGPYRVSGGWWKRLVERDYYYAETNTGDLLWLFFDRPRKRWFLHGVVD